jgi:hypothetical protein
MLPINLLHTSGHIAQFPIDIRNLFHPELPLRMFQLQNFLERPVKVVGNVGYLLVELIEGVANYSPE